MEQSEPSFVPEWYKGTISTATGISNSDHNSESSHSDEHNGGFSSRNRSSVTMSVCDNDALRSSTSSGRTSLYFERSANSNGSMGWEKNSHSRGYNNFSRSHRDNYREQEKDLDFRKRDRLLLDNGFSNYPDSLIINTFVNDFSKRSQTLSFGQRGVSWLKRTGNDSSNGVLSGGSMVTGITKSSFERNFPSLGPEKKHLGSDITRLSSPGLSTAISILPLRTLAIIGGNGWTSALAEVPPIAVGSDQVISPALQTNHTPTISSTTTGFNMAETLVLTTGRVNTVHKQPIDSQKIEKLHHQQILKLRPVTSSMLKNSFIFDHAMKELNTVDKSKTKESRIAEFSSTKQQSSFCSTEQQSSFSSTKQQSSFSSIRSEASKASLPTHFQVLNRGRNGLSLAASSSLINDSRVPTSSAGVNLPSKDTINSKLKIDANGGDLALKACGEKKIHSQVQKRNDFFNSLRKKTSAIQTANASDDPICDTSSSNLQKLDEMITVDSIPVKLPSLLNSSSVDYRNCFSDGCCAFEEPAKLAPDEEEAAFLRSLGWEENAGEEALTREEIESFLSEYKKRLTALKLTT